MTLVAPSETIKPTSTDSPLNASVCAPGRYGYAIAEREHPDDEAENAPRRPGGVRVDPRELAVAALDLVEENRRDTHDRARDQKDHDRKCEPRQRRDDREQQLGHQPEEPVFELLAPRPRKGKAPENETQPGAARGTRAMIQATSVNVRRVSRNTCPCVEKPQAASCSFPACVAALADRCRPPIR
jgi:hypothetical protein